MRYFCFTPDFDCEAGLFAAGCFESAAGCVPDSLLCEAPALADPSPAAEALAPLGVEWRPGEGGPESDIGPFARDGAAWAWLGHDGTEYFDLHHTPDDTLDKIDPATLRQNVAAYAVFTYLAAQAEGDFGSAPRE